ncbi:hypothetical protein CA235_07260 [Sphingomonas sp. ABOLF]|uniref:hypothetical protein n=1 Tax=Sphingomonas sp. ABOLF TaxID=1985879 RepID=UPI000F7E5163|nr:hypothetical protein [Sphingomonas sp. ABOLF]RSV15644.1 hypothetical protein CA235_07260 [Sphingomonas sp. ABOLF]
MERIIWQFRYARIALRSIYDFNPLSAWREANASWEAQDDMRGNEPMPTPAEAFSDDVESWRDEW